MYILERYIEGAWYVWGKYDRIDALVRAAAELGSYGYTEGKIRVSSVEKN